MLKKFKKRIDEEYTKIISLEEAIFTFFDNPKYIEDKDVIEFKKEHSFPSKLSSLSGFWAIFNSKVFKDYKTYSGRYDTIHNLYYYYFDKNVLEHNDKVTRKLMINFESLCGKVEGKELDDKQVNAIVRDVPNQLILAGAGSGKTTMIVAKIKYLLKTEAFKSDELLVLSFTNASSEELKKRLYDELKVEIPVYTFHKFGLEIIKKCGDEKANIYKCDLAQFLEKTIRDLINNDKYYLNDLITFITNYKYSDKDEFSFASEDEYNDYLQKNAPITLKREKVKSYGELEIANYLYKNGINYKYEDAYFMDTSNDEYDKYYPDFYLPDYNIYIEYFGIDKDGNVPSYFKGKDGIDAKTLYNNGIKWKRQIHKENNSVLIESYYYELADGSCLEKLENTLKEHGVIFNKIPDLKLWEEVSSTHELMAVTSFFETIINLLKSNNYILEDFKNLIKNKGKRLDLLVYNLVSPLYISYNNYLRENNLIDFNDMINLATSYINDLRFDSPYKFVIVDEYQDISKSRYILLKSLREKHDYQLFCVGDDWQSIYRFNGSDVGLIINFEGCWGKTLISKLNKTYRFSDKLAAISSDFIQQNPFQIGKDISGYESKKFPLKIIKEYNEKQLLMRLGDFLQILKLNSSVLFIGRYKTDINIMDSYSDFTYNFNNETKMHDVKYAKRKDLLITFLTAHKSKGLQADYVVILNNKNDNMGFPSKIVDSPIIDMLLTSSDNYPYGEERRLFYVAMTRAKIKTVLLVLKNNVSVFVTELEKKYSIELRKENYECPMCESGMLIKRNSVYGEFYGCNKYPDCKYKRK